jgi:heme exporter protein A
MSVSQAPAPPTLSIDRLAVRRGERTVFEGVSLVSRPFTAVMVRGPNGAGKSSLLLSIAGVLPPAAGTIRFSDENGGDEDLGPNLHFVGHQTGVKTRLTLTENLKFWAGVFSATGGVSPEAALEAVGLSGRGGLDAGYLSAGQTRRLALARLLVAPRIVWLLDEPTAALDAEGDRMVERLITEHVQHGGIVVVATHHDLAVDAPGGVETLDLGSA